MRRVLILGNGWGGMTVARLLSKMSYRVTVVSPRNHFVFTPLLAGTAVGTLEFRNVCEPTRQTCKKVEFCQGECVALDPYKRTAHCVSVFQQEKAAEGAVYTPKPRRFPSDTVERQEFDIEFDDCVIAVGAKVATFNTPGVEQHAVFLKEVIDAQTIRQRIIHNFEIAAEPSTPAEAIRNLLHFVIVGGGPTGVEFAGELSDFLRQDLHKAFPDVARYARVTIVEASGQLLGAFHPQLRRFAARRLARGGVEVRKAAVKEVQHGRVILTDGRSMSCGLTVWSTGIVSIPFIRDPVHHGLEVASSGRLRVDHNLRCYAYPSTAAAGDNQAHSDDPVRPFNHIFAIGDCCDVDGAHFPATAQVAAQEGKHVVRVLTRLQNIREAKGVMSGDLHINRPEALVDTGTVEALSTDVAKRVASTHDPNDPLCGDNFMDEFQNRGMLAYLGGYRALHQVGDWRGHGLLSWVLWRSAYLTMLMSWRNKFLVPLTWMKTFFFGRDISYLYDWRKVSYWASGNSTHASPTVTIDRIQSDVSRVNK